MAINLPQRRLVSQDDKAITQRPDIPRSQFQGSKTRKTTFDAGDLVPFFLDEILPGDMMRYEVTSYIRMATPLFPLFDNQRIDTFIFFVPCRLLWENWARFMGEQDDPADTIDYTIPQIVSPGGGHSLASIYDHFALPTSEQIDGTDTISHSALPLRAYNLIWNQWFRDQNIQDSVSVPKTDGPDLYSLYTLKKRAKSHDYFTSALPWPQKFTSPPVSLGGLAPVIGLGGLNQIGTTGPVTAYETEGPASYDFYKKLDTGNDNHSAYMEMSAATNAFPEVYADLSAATGITMNVFRQAFMVQSLLEKDARGGTRYVEMIRQHFGVTNPDFRLQRPEYIGGGQTALQLTPVAQTAPTAGAPVGALGAAGTAVGQHKASYAATEHGYVIGLINVRSELSYSQGIHRLWSRTVREEFYFPSFAALGEQAILRKEIYAKGTTLNDDAVFGYQESWHEYRTMYSETTGLMRPGVLGTLDAWHLQQHFATAPTLSDTFIQDSPPMERVLAAGVLADNQQYLADILISRTATRPIPTFGTPALLGRF